jgi:hypothetical protein
MMFRSRELLRRKWEAFSQTPFGCLLRLFVGRMFQGSSEPGGENLGLGMGVALILLAMPGILVSLLMFGMYGSLIRFLRGQPAFNPFTSTLSDEYFFIVLSMVVTGAAALWRWDSIFLDRRDYTNLVPLPISVRSLFFANLLAIVVFVSLLTFVANVASSVLFPIAVLGSQGSFLLLFRFAAGHIVTLSLASAVSCFTVFAAAGVLMALLPAGTFRRVSLFARFLLAICLLALLATSLTVPQLLTRVSIAHAHRIAMFPPVSFLGLLRTVWGSGDPFLYRMAKAAIAALGFTSFVTIVTYAASFRRHFLAIGETSEGGALPRLHLRWSPSALLEHTMLRTPTQRAGFHFVARTLLRSDAHLQVVLAGMALGLIAAADKLVSAPHADALIGGKWPRLEVLSVPFILSYCTIVGIRFAFEIPVDLRANWIFRLWIDPDRHEARAIARRVLLFFTLSWLAPACFIATLWFWGWTTALLHTGIVILCSTLLVELLLIKFRKIAFTCAYPAFQSHSGVIALLYVLGFFLFASYMPQMDQWSVLHPWQAIWFIPVSAAILTGLYQYRKQMLDMDKQLVFEESSASAF